MWPVDYIPADFTSVVIGLRESETCGDAAKLIDKGRAILRQLRRRKARLPSEEVMRRWKHSLAVQKRLCRNRRS